MMVLGTIKKLETECRYKLLLYYSFDCKLETNINNL